MKTVALVLKAAYYWMLKDVYERVGLLSKNPSSPFGESSEKGEGSSSEKREDTRPIFPYRISLMRYSGETNHTLVKHLRAKMDSYGPPTYADERDGTERGRNGVTWLDMLQIWTARRLRLLKSGRPLEQAIASLPVIWGYYLAHPDAGEEELRQVFEGEHFVPDEQEYNAVANHVLGFLLG